MTHHLDRDQNLRPHPIDPEVRSVFNSYSPAAQKRLLKLRALIFSTADEIDDLVKLEETLKWGEPSYIAKKGSTIRIAWKEKTPDRYAMYFKCTSKLVPAFKESFGELFKYETSRALVFDMDEQLPEEALKKCIRAALTYHNVKGHPTLGICT